MCFIPGTYPHWGTLRLKHSRAFLVFLQVFSPLSQWGDALHCAFSLLLGQERGKEDGRIKRSNNEQDLR